MMNATLPDKNGLCIDRLLLAGMIMMQRARATSIHVEEEKNLYKLSHQDEIKKKSGWSDC